MKDQLVSFETAKLAKEKGFSFHLWPDWAEVKAFINGGRAHHVLPTQSLLQRWLREEHKIVITISHWIKQPVNGKIWSNCYEYNFHQLFHETIIYKTYEEALEAGLQEALKVIKS